MNIDIQKTLGTWIRRSLSPYFFLRQRCRDARLRERSALRIPCRSDVSLKYGHAMEMPWKWSIDVYGKNMIWVYLGDLWLIGWWIFWCGLPQELCE